MQQTLPSELAYLYGRSWSGMATGQLGNTLISEAWQLRSAMQSQLTGAAAIACAPRSATHAGVDKPGIYRFCLHACSQELMV
jgi:hypothetical protein